MANFQTLSASNLRYLMVMKGLGENGRGVRCTDVATELGLSKPSVHNMMHTFRDMGLIRKDAYGASFFTEAGSELVERYSQYVEALSKLLAEYFPKEAPLQTAVYAMVSEMPEQDLAVFLRRAKEGQQCVKF